MPRLVLIAKVGLDSFFPAGGDKKDSSLSPNFFRGEKHHDQKDFQGRIVSAKEPLANQ
jgi:hypothetical protein